MTAEILGALLDDPLNRLAYDFALGAFRMTTSRWPLVLSSIALLAAPIAIADNVAESREVARYLESTGDAHGATTRFSDCLTLPGDCLTQGPSLPPDEALSSLVLQYLKSAHELALRGDAATANDDLGLLRHWNSLIDAIRQRQTAAREAATGKPIGLATIRLVEPLSGGAAEGCIEPSGTLFSGDYLDADLHPDPGPLSELTIALECAGAEDAGNRTCRAQVEIAASGGPDGKGTGLDLMLRDVPVEWSGPLWTFLDPRADASRYADDPKTLFSVLYDCRAGFGILSWGSLLDYDTWP